MEEKYKESEKKKGGDKCGVVGVCDERVEGSVL